MPYVRRPFLRQYKDRTGTQQNASWYKTVLPGAYVFLLKSKHCFMIFMLPVSAFYACKTHSYAASPEYTSAAKRAAGICPAALVTNRLLLRRNTLPRNGSRRKRLWFPLTHYGQFAVGTHLQADRGERLFAVQHQGDNLILHFLF